MEPNQNTFKREQTHTAQKSALLCLAKKAPKSCAFRKKEAPFCVDIVDIFSSKKRNLKSKQNVI